MTMLALMSIMPDDLTMMEDDTLDTALFTGAFAETTRVLNTVDDDDFEDDFDDDDFDDDDDDFEDDDEFEDDDDFEDLDDLEDDDDEDEAF